jgi:hypothetical protein
MPPTPNSPDRISSTRHSSRSSPMIRNDKAVRAHNGTGTCYGRRSNTRFRARAICRAQASPGDPNLLAVNGLASSTSSTYRDTAGGVMRVRFFRLGYAITTLGSSNLARSAVRSSRLGRPHGLLGRPSAPLIALDFERCVLLKGLIISARAHRCRHLAAPKRVGSGHNSRAIPTRLLSIIERSSDAGGSWRIRRWCVTMLGPIG